MFSGIRSGSEPKPKLRIKAAERVAIQDMVSLAQLTGIATKLNMIVAHYVLDSSGKHNSIKDYQIEVTNPATSAVQGVRYLGSNNSFPIPLTAAKEAFKAVAFDPMGASGQDVEAAFAKVTSVSLAAAGAATTKRVNPSIFTMKGALAWAKSMRRRSLNRAAQHPLPSLRPQ